MSTSEGLALGIGILAIVMLYVIAGRLEAIHALLERWEDLRGPADRELDEHDEPDEE
jgi:hypothetical protein